MPVHSDQRARRAPDDPVSVPPPRRPTGETYRHPYGGDRHENPLRARLTAFDDPEESLVPPPQEPDTNVTQRLRQIREISNRAIGSIDDLLQRTA